jgi:hypothetical protein
MGFEATRILNDDFSGGIVLDDTVLDKNELLQAKNIKLLGRGGFQVRNGSDVKNQTKPITVGAGEITSIVELRRRNFTNNTETNFLIVTIDNDGVFEIRYLTRNGNTLDITAEGKLHEKWPIATDVVYWANGDPRWEVTQNRAIMVNGAQRWDPAQGAEPVGFTPAGDRYWTDGSDGYRLGIDTPNTLGEGLSLKIEAVDDGAGSMSDGFYAVAITYVRNSNYQTESNPWQTMVDAAATTITYIELSGGNDTQWIKATLTFADVNDLDAQIDEIWAYRTLLSSTEAGMGATYYYTASLTGVAPDMDPSKQIDLKLADNTIITAAASNPTMQTDNDRPPASVDLCYAAGRMFYATQDTVFYSKPNRPEQVPAVNLVYVGQDDRQNIKAMVALSSNRILVIKNRSTWVFDATYPGEVNPVSVSRTVGVRAANTVVVSADGKIAIWLSQEGSFVVCDGRDIRDICYDPAGRRASIYFDLQQNLDFTNIKDAHAEFYPRDLVYVAYVPYLNSQPRIWKYHIVLDAWTKDSFPFTPSAIALATDETNRTRLICGANMIGTLAAADNTYGYIIELDENPGDEYKDISKPGDVISAYTDISLDVVTAWNHLGYPEREKRLHHVVLLWESAVAVTDGELSVSFDYGGATGVPFTKTLTHSGKSGSVGLGYDYVPGWDFISAETFDTPVQSLGAGVSFSTRLALTTSGFVKIHALMYRLTVEGSHV